MANQARKAIQDTSGDLSRLSAATAAASSSTGSMSRQTDSAFKSLGKWGNQLQWTGRQLQYNWTLPIAAAGAAATKFALDQERAMTRVRKVYGDSSMAFEQKTKEVAALEKAFVALSNRYAVNIEETANIAAEWAAAGASGLALARNVELTMKTMVLGELDAAAATEALVAIQAQYGFNSEQLADTLARLNAIENETGVKTQDLIVAFSKTAGVARTAGVNVQELGGMVAALVPAAGTASQAGNALKTIISRLLSPTGEASDVMNAMGLNIDSVSWQSMNATSRLKTLSDAYVGLTDSQKAVANATIASRYHLNKADILFAALAANSSYYTKALEVAADGADYFKTAEMELNTVLDSSPHKMKQVGVILQNSMIKIIQPLLPAIIGLAQGLATAAQKFADLDPNVVKLIAVGLAFLAVLGLVARYVGSMATLVSVLGRSFGWLATPLTAAAGSFSLFGKKANDELENTNKASRRTTRDTVAKMRGELLKGIPGLTGTWTKMRVGATAQVNGMRAGILKRLAMLRLDMGIIWLTTWGRMKAVMLARITGMVALLRATMVPSFVASMANLRIALWARWTVTWSYMMAPIMGFIARSKAALIGHWATLRLWATAGGTMSVWAAFWIRMQLVTGIAMSAMMTRLKAFGAPFVALWGRIGAAANGLWTRLRFAMVAIDWTMSTLLMGVGRKIAAPFVAMWGAVAGAANRLWTKLRFAFVAIDWTMSTLLMGVGRKLASPFVAMWGAIGRARAAVWAAGNRALLAVSWAIYGPLKTMTVAGGIMLGNAWKAVGTYIRRIWGMTLMFMRIQWLAFVTFLKTPGALMAAFKSMGAVFAAGGRGLMAIMTALRTGLIAIITSPWFIAIAIVVGAIILFRDQIAKVWQNIKDYFSNANNGIVKTFDALPNGIKNAFLKVVAFVKAAAMKVYEWMQYLNPFARHSPSLVDNVTAGLAVVRAQFGTLTQIAGPIAQAYVGIKNLKDATAGLRQGMASAKLAEDVEELAKVAPQAVGPFKALSNTLVTLESKAEALESVINGQEQTVQVWRTALDDASDALDRQKDVLDGLNDVVQGYEDQISGLQKTIDDLSNTPLTGMGAMEDAIFENEMAQKRWNLAIMDMEDAGQSYDDVKSRIASLNGEIESLRGTQNDLRSAGAGSEILSVYDDQIRAIEAQQAAMEQQVGPIDEAKKAISELEREAARLDLEKSLAFDPLTRQIEKASSTMQEMPFDQVIGGIRNNRAAIDSLQAGYDAATAAVAAQERQVAAAQAVHDEIQAGYDRENQKLSVLKDSYDQVAAAISDVTQAMGDLRSATGAGGAGSESPALHNFNAAAAGEDFADVGGDFTIGREGGLGDQSAEIDEFTKQIEEEMGAAFGGLDMFAPIKDMWNKFTGWWDSTVGTFFTGGAVGGFLEDVFEGVDFLQPIRDTWEDVEKIFTETDWEGIIEDVWSAVSEWFENVWDFVEIFEEILGPDVMETFNIIGDQIKEWWNAIVDAFTGGEVGSVVGDLTDAFKAFWGFVFPILQGLWAVVLMVVQVIWSAFNGVLGPVLEWIGKMFGNIWDIIVGFWNVVAGIFTGDWDRVWKGVKSIFSGVWDSIWDTLVAIGKSIWGFISGIMSGIWDNITWVWNKIQGVLGWIGSKFMEMANWVGSIFSAMGNGIRWVWDHTIGWVFSKLWDWLQALPGYWQTAANAIGNAWDSVKEKAKTPIQWVVDFVWNNGLRKLWNVINNLWGGDDIDRFSFAKGGVMPGYTPGRDVHKFFSPTGGLLELSGGEGILRPEATRAIGGKEGIDALNTAARHGGVDGVRDLLALEPQYFKDGGIVNLPGWVNNIIRWIPGMGAVSDAIDLINGNQGGAGSGLLGSGMLKIPVDVLKKIWDKVSAWWDDDDPKSEGGVRGSGGGTVADRMWRVIKEAFPRAKLNSGARNTNDYHGQNKAIDLGEQGFSGGTGRHYLAEMEAWIYKHVANITELIYNGLYDNTPNMKNGAKNPYSKSVQDDHKNHTHWAMKSFDRGGVMNNGTGGFNSSGRPERVLTGRQTETFDRLLNFLERTGIPSPDALEGAIFKASVKANRAETIGNQTIVNGDMGTTNVTVNFYGDLSFPNVTDGDDADDFLQNLGDLAGSR